jgi:hypothetical protein
MPAAPCVGSSPHRPDAPLLGGDIDLRPTKDRATVRFCTCKAKAVIG